MVKKHFHKLKRLKYKNGETVFFCMMDDCTFKIHTELSLGKTFTCNRCLKPFSMNVLTKRMAKPHCDDCTKKAKAPDLPSLKSLEDDSVEDLKRRLRESFGSTTDPDTLDEDML